MPPALSHDLFHQLAMNIGQPIVPAFVAVSQALVVDPEVLQQRRVEVMHAHGVFGDVVSEIIGLAMDIPGLEAAAGDPDGEALGMMIAAEIVLADRSLRIGGAAKFTTPDDDGVIEQAA